MIEVELSDRRRDDFDDESMARLRSDWPSARRAERSRPYDEGELFELAATYRNAREVRWSVVRCYLWPNVDGARPMGCLERRAWFSVLSDRGYVHAPTREEALDRLAERSSEYVTKWSPERVLQTLLERGAEAPSYTPNVGNTWLMYGALLRHELPWCDTLEALEPHMEPGVLCAFAEGLGPCPVAERERASALTGRLVVATSPPPYGHHVHGLLNVAPNQEHVAELIEAFMSSNETPAPDHRDAMLWTQAWPDLERVMKTRRLSLNRAHVQRVYARWGFDGVSLLMSHGLDPKKSRPSARVFQEVTKIHAPEVVQGAFTYVVSRNELGDIMRAYIDDASPEHAAHGLIACCNRAGKKRTWAVEELRRLADRADGVQAIEAALTQWKKATSDFVRAEVLDHEGPFDRVPIEDAPAWAIALAEACELLEPPRWLRDGELSPLITRGGIALPDSCARGLSYRDLAEVPEKTSARRFDEVLRERLTEESLSALALDLMALWCAAPSLGDGASAHTIADARPIDWLGRFPSAAGVAALEDYVRTKRLPNRRLDDPAWLLTHAAETLAAIDSVEALAATLRLEETGRPSVKSVCARAVKQEMKRRRVRRDELCHMAIPTFGLDAHGERDFDYGPRTIRLRVSGASLEYVDLSTGKASSRAPKGTRRDDADRVAASSAELSLVHKPLSATLRAQVMAFEEDMVLRVNWKARHWREHIAGHPLLGAMATRLVWTVKPPGGPRAFARPTSDGSLLTVDLEDAPWPEDTEIVRIAHPLELGEQLGSWSEHLSSFEITQPFEQLGRASYLLDDADTEMLSALEHERAHLSPKVLRKIMGPRAGKLVETSRYGRVTTTYTLTDRLEFELERTSSKDRNSPMTYLHTKYMGEPLGVGGQGSLSYATLERVLRSEALRVLRRALLED